MKQHFSAVYANVIDGFCIVNETDDALAVIPDAPFYVYADNNEITRGCINRIVDNLNKLAEYKSKQDVVS